MGVNLPLIAYGKYIVHHFQGSKYPLRVSLVTLKWTDPAKILPKGQLESNLLYTVYCKLYTVLHCTLHLYRFLLATGRTEGGTDDGEVTVS